METKPGRPRERKGDYQRITLEIRDDLLSYLDSKSGSRRDNVEQLLEQDKEKSQMAPRETTNKYKVEFTEKGATSPTVSRYTTKKAADEDARILRKTEKNVKVEKIGK